MFPTFSTFAILLLRRCQTELPPSRHMRVALLSNPNPEIYSLAQPDHTCYNGNKGFRATRLGERTDRLLISYGKSATSFWTVIAIHALLTRLKRTIVLCRPHPLQKLLLVGFSASGIQYSYGTEQPYVRTALGERRILAWDMLQSQRLRNCDHHLLSAIVAHFRPNLYSSTVP
jgi:hypothetical protein